MSRHTHYSQVSISVEQSTSSRIPQVAIFNNMLKCQGNNAEFLWHYIFQTCNVNIYDVLWTEHINFSPIHIRYITYITFNVIQYITYTRYVKVISLQCIWWHNFSKLASVTHRDMHERPLIMYIRCLSEYTGYEYRLIFICNAGTTVENLTTVHNESIVMSKKVNKT